MEGKLSDSLYWRAPTYKAKRTLIEVSHSCLASQPQVPLSTLVRRVDSYPGPQCTMWTVRQNP